MRPLFTPRGKKLPSTGATGQSAGDYIRESFRDGSSPAKHIRLKELAQRLADRKRITEPVKA